MLKVDLHLHTVASGHAHSTILEYINRAQELKMEIIGFTDHGPALKCSLADEVYFKCLPRIPSKIGNLLILKGVEANILNIDGEIDVSDRIIEKLDFVIAGFHSGVDYGCENNIGNNTKAIINTIKSSKINIISHPFLIKHYKIDIEAMSYAACEHNVLLEINTHYLAESELLKDTFSNLIKIIKQHQQKVIVNSDAHNIWEMANDDSLKKIQNKIGLTEEMIINNYPEELLEKLKIKKA